MKKSLASPLFHAFRTALMLINVCVRRCLIAALSACLFLPLWSQAADATPPAARASATSPADYRVSRGDELNFRFFYTPELNTMATVRSDGKVSLPLIGDLVVEEQTIPQLAATVERLMGTQVKRPQVMINVQGNTTQRVFVGGEVGRPGMQLLVGPLTALSAVMVAEGFRDTAQPENVVVIRRSVQGQTQTFGINLSAAMRGDANSQDLLLQPNDVIVVPRSGIANVNNWVEQYIRRLSPFGLGISYSINRTSSIQ